MPPEWASQQSLEAFKHSPEYDIYFKGISEHGQPASEEVVFPGMGMGMARNSTHYRPSITKIYFPHPITEEHKSAVRNFSGIYTPSIVRTCHFGSREKSTTSVEQRREAQAKKFKGYYSNTSQGWKLQFENVEGVEMDVLIWVYWWFNAETEQKGKRCRGRQFHRPRRENLSNFEVWQQKMREVGAVSSVEEHWECQYICQTWEKMQAEAQARLPRSHNAQPLTFDQVFGPAQ